MKKFMALLMSMLLVLGLAACGGETQSDVTPYDVVKQASEKLNNADGVAYSMTMGMSMSDPSDEENSIAMDINGDIKMQKIAENDYYIDYHMVTDMSDITDEDGSIAMDAYYADGYMYYDMSDLGIQYKVAMDMQEAMDTINSSSLTDLERDMVKEQSIAADGDGQIVTLLLDGSKMTDLVQSMSGELVALGEDDKMVIQDMPYTVYLDCDGNITSIETDMSFSMAAEGMEMNMAMDIYMTVEQIGGVVVDLPADLAEYEELDLGI